MKIDYKLQSLSTRDTVVCEHCDIDLYKVVRTHYGARLKADMFKSLWPDIPDPTPNSGFKCPRCGNSLLGMGGIRVRAA